MRVFSAFVHVGLVSFLVMEKDFDKWNEEKKVNEKKEIERTFFYNERDVWWCALGINIGVEEDGKNKNFERPVLIIKKFNQHMFWGVPLTSQERLGNFYEKVTHEGGCSYVLLSQFKTFSVKRLLRKIGRISEDQFNTVRRKIKGFI